MQKKAQGARAPPPNCLEGQKVPFFVMKSTPFVEANVLLFAHSDMAFYTR